MNLRHHANVFGFSNAIAARGGIDIDYLDIDKKSVDICRSQTDDKSDLATACVLVARAAAKTKNLDVPDQRVFATLAGRLLYEYRNGTLQTRFTVDQHCEQELHYLKVSESVRAAAYKWLSSMLFMPMEFGA